MEWQHADEQAVLTWTVKAIDRNIMVWWYVFALPVGVPFFLSGYFYFSGNDLLAFCLVFPFLMSVFLFYKIGMEKTVFVYRATEQRLEVCQWQDIPDLVFTFLRIFPFIVVGIILMTFISSPGLSIAALVGPALVGILLASVGADSNYKTIYKKFGRHEFRWSDICQAMLDEKKGLLALSVDGPTKVVKDEEIDLSNPEHHMYLYPIYFRLDQQEAVLGLFKDRMSVKVQMVPGNYKYVFAG
ncbi:hypothetical protein CK507_02940 [Pseudomonas sp. WN033]|nr:hypothetical protein CK507_02940 [Pseudomonas sp. WN033]